MLDLAQVFAWSRMFSGYLRSESIAKAATETFDPAKPCSICLALCKAREAANNRTPAVPASGAEKIILILDRPGEFAALVMPEAWPEFRDNIASSPGTDVPVPPPRGTALIVLA
jgi:hypothetical protein